MRVLCVGRALAWSRNRRKRNSGFASGARWLRHRLQSRRRALLGKSPLRVVRLAAAKPAKEDDDWTELFWRCGRGGHSQWRCKVGAGPCVKIPEGSSGPNSDGPVCTARLVITGMETIKQHTRAAYGWSVVGQYVGTGLVYAHTPALSVTWTASLQLRYAACSAIQLIYVFSFALPIATPLGIHVWGSPGQFKNRGHPFHFPPFFPSIAFLTPLPFVSFPQTLPSPTQYGPSSPVPLYFVPLSYCVQCTK